MRYRLIVLTHGAGPEPLASTLRSFREHVQPAPEEVVIVQDGPCEGKPSYETALSGLYWRLSASETQQGFCLTTGRAWAESALDGPAWCYWLEHDFIHLRDLYLAELAGAMNDHPHVAQMAPLRGPVNDEERAHGSYVAQHRARYDHRLYAGGLPWLETTRNWTTNPHLRRSALAADHPWPTGPECEGTFGFELRARRPGSTFGIWGDGTPWVRHVGVRDGYGY